MEGVEEGGGGGRAEKFLTCQYRPVIREGHIREVG